MKKYIFWGLLFVLIQTGYGQNRKTYFLHGFGGNASEMTSMANSLAQTHKMDPVTVGYDSKNGIVNAGASAASQMPGTGALAIGHSMGGVTLRQIDKQSTRPFTAMISIGSPHAGAEAARSLVSGKGKSIATRALVLAGSGFVADPLTTMISSPISWSTLKFIIALAGTTATTKLLNGKLTELDNQSARELQPGSAFFQGNQATNTPLVSIVGVEDKQTFYRIATYEANLQLGLNITESQGVAEANRIGNWYLRRAATRAVGAVFALTPVTRALRVAQSAAWLAGGAQILYFMERDWNEIYAGTRSSNPLGDGFIARASQDFPYARKNEVVYGVNHSEERYSEAVNNKIRDIMVGAIDSRLAVDMR